MSVEEKTNVLVVHNRYQIGGGEDSVFGNEVELLKSHGLHVEIYTRNNDDIHRYNLMSKLMIPLCNIFSIKVFREIRKVIREKNIQVVHVHNTLPLIGSSVYFAAFSLKIPVVQTVHNYRLICPGGTMYNHHRVDMDCLNKGLIHSILRKCYRGSLGATLAVAVQIKINRMLHIYKKMNFIFLTPFARDLHLRMNRKHLVIDPLRSYIKPNFVPQVDSNLSQSTSHDGYVYVGRLDEMKGIRTLLEAWNILGNTSMPLTICGDGPLSDWCRAFIEKNHINNVNLMGRVQHKDVQNIIYSARAVIVPSEWLEGMPMVILEAYSQGTPVIASDLGNVNDLVVENTTGVHFKAGSPAKLAAAVLKLSNTRFSRKKIEKYYQDNYSQEKNFEQLMSIYKKVISNNE